MSEKPTTPPDVDYTFTVQATIEGVTGPLVIRAMRVDEIRRAVHLLRENQLLNVQIPAAWSYTPEGLPICPKHGVPMKKREKQGDVWHSHSVGERGEDLYCRGYPGKESPGWEY
ncbi:MAG TPA: hypothetical protein VFZ66_29750 [Herpetosiphonaceae bacterium]